MVSANELYRRILLGEDSTLELKRVLFSGNKVTDPSRKSFSDELAGMANSVGGTILLGVDDKTRDIIGIPVDRLDLVETWIREICNDSIKPPLDVTIRKIELPLSSDGSSPIIRIDVPRSLFVHMSSGGYFTRIGSSKREMAPEILSRLFQERSQSRVIRFDESIVPTSSQDDLDGPLTTRFVRGGDPDDDSVLRKLRIVADDDEGVARLTVAGVLLCVTEPIQWMPHAYIQAISYTGERSDVNYQNDARDFIGPLDSQVMEALGFVRRNMFVEADKQVARVTRPQFSERAVFEALVNAVAHRDYSMAGARIRLHMFRNRLELYVPGPLVNTLTPDSLHLRQYSRNELVVSLLSRCPVDPSGLLERSHMMEKRGDGVPIILEESIQLSGQTPEYTLIDDSELRLVIWSS